VRIHRKNRACIMLQPQMSSIAAGWPLAGTVVEGPSPSAFAPLRRTGSAPRGAHDPHDVSGRPTTAASTGTECPVPAATIPALPTARIRAPSSAVKTVNDLPLGGLAPPDPLRKAITRHWLADEAGRVRALLDEARRAPAEAAAITATATDLVRRVRARAREQGVVESFMRQYDLGSEEGVLLMCVAEALLRIPDPDTTDKLIRDKLGDADWKRHKIGRASCR